MSAWGGYVFIINLIPLHVFVLLIIGRFSHRTYIGINFWIFDSIVWPYDTCFSRPFLNKNEFEMTQKENIFLKIWLGLIRIVSQRVSRMLWSKDIWALKWTFIFLRKKINFGLKYFQIKEFWKFYCEYILFCFNSLPKCRETNNFRGLLINWLYWN